MSGYAIANPTYITKKIYLMNDEVLSNLVNSINSFISKFREDLYLIYSEYLQWLDICCLNMEEIEVIKDSPIYALNKGHDDFIYQLPVLQAIELKFIKGNRPGNLQKFIQNEEKIMNSGYRDRIKNYLSICFIQCQEIAKFHIGNKPSEFKIDEVNKIEKLDISYVISPEKTYALTKI
jgi:hypothetical protein